MPKKSKSGNWTNLSSNIRQVAKPEMRRLTWVTSTGGASVSVRFGTDSVTSAAEWSSYASRFTECRVLGIKISFAGTPVTAGTGAPLMFVGTDRSGSVAAGLSPAATAQLDAVKVFNTSNTSMTPMSYQAKALDLEDQLFTPVGSASTTKNYSIHATNQAAVAFNCLVEFLVEFKGHQ